MIIRIFTITPPEGRNIYEDEEYGIINNELYRFIFTEQDDENAEDCGEIVNNTLLPTKYKPHQNGVYTLPLAT